MRCPICGGDFFVGQEVVLFTLGRMTNGRTRLVFGAMSEELWMHDPCFTEWLEAEHPTMLSVEYPWVEMDDPHCGIAEERLSAGDKVLAWRVGILHHGELEIRPAMQAGELVQEFAFTLTKSLKPHLQRLVQTWFIPSN